ncbi:MAG: CCA tRNA nucleotidyltransferase [Anaerovoracaceae bacterium]|jgi:tRNA nucleotidyltransferase (CCA-adding enzyme)
MKIQLPDKVRTLIAVLEEHGYAAYAVGGCVRDRLLGREPQDWDLCTAATPEEMEHCFAGFHVEETGLQHGTLTVVLDHEPFEITTFRIDGTYRDHRRPDAVTFTDSLTEDLRRRDFTINAMACSDRTGLVDPFGGQRDLAAGTVRCVDDPARRFSEDALRILRCVRFAAVLDFAIEEKTAAEMLEQCDSLQLIAAERQRVELVKLLCGRAAAAVMRQYREVIAAVVPEMRPAFDCDQQNDFHIYDVWEHILHTVDAIPAQPLLRLAAFFHDIGKPACKTVTDEGWGHFYRHERVGAKITDAVMRRLHFDNRTRETVVELVARHGIVFRSGGKQPHRLLVRLGEEQLRRLIELERADVRSQAPQCVDERLRNIDAFTADVERVIREENCFSLRDLAVDGNDIIAVGVPRGPQVGRVLRRLLDDVIEGKVNNDKVSLLRAVKNYHSIF